MHKAAMKPVSLKYNFNKYSGGGDLALTNALEGSSSLSDGNWQGFEQNDLDATIDLGRVMPVTQITSHYLQNTHSWIFFPSRVEYQVSDDGKTFRPVGGWDIPVT